MRRIHSSWLIAVISFTCVVGVWASQYIYGLSDWWLLVCGAFAVIIFWRRRMWVIPLAVTAGLLVGLVRGGHLSAQLGLYKPFIGKTMTISGTVSDDATTDTSGALVVPLGHVKIAGHELAGSLWATSSTRADVRRGDIVTVHGKMMAGFGAYAVSMYRAKILAVEDPSPGDVARKIRDVFVGGIKKAIPDPEAALGIGYLVGEKSSLPVVLNTAMQVVGLTHVVVASGYNLTILVRLARRIFIKVSKFFAAFMSGGMMISFMAVAGMSPSMTRAGLVSGLSLLTWYYGRRVHPLVLLPLAAAITVLINPSYGWNNLGWALSFLSFAGVMVVAPLLQQYFFGDKKPGMVRQIFGETLAAHLVTAPIIIMAFGYVSNVALLANIAVLPLVPLAMLLVFIAGIAGLIMPSVAWIVGLPATWLLTYMVKITEYFAGLSWAQTNVTMAPLGLLACYLFMVILGMYVQRKTKLNLWSQSVVE
jgi:competence protein ComEC